MAVESEVTEKVYSPASAQAVEALSGVYFLDAGDLVVEHWLPGAETGTLLVQDQDYIIAGDGRSATGTIQALAEWPEADTWRIYRATPAKQPQVIPPFEPLPAKALERGFDRGMLILQEQIRELRRAPMMPRGEAGFVLPSASRRTGGKIWGFDRENGAFSVIDGSDFKGDPGGNVESVGKFATVVAQTISVGATTIRVSDRDQSVLGEVPLATMLPASGQGKWWTTSNGGTRLWQIVSTLTSRALGAAIDGATNDNAVIKELVEVAGPWFGKPVYISTGTHSIVRATAADVFYVPQGAHIILQPGAQLKGTINRAGAGYYLPFFAVINKTGAIIEGANEKQFIFTGRLTYGVGQDFGDATVDTVVSDTRLGTASAIRADAYASGILLVSSHNITVLGVGCRNVDGSAAARGPAFCHGFLSTSGGCDNLVYDHLYMDDVVLGTAVQGGGGGYGGYISVGRMSQDIGIPGHARYDYRWYVAFGPTVDTGEEWGADLTKQIGHSISIAGSGPTSVGPIVSNRRHGPVNIKNATKGVVFESIVWFPLDRRAGGAEILPEQARVYGVTGSGNTNITIKSMQLDSNGADVCLVGGAFGVGSQIQGTLIRKDTGVTTTPYVALSGNTVDWDLLLVQKGTVDPVTSIDCVGVVRNNTLRLKLQGFIGAAPVVRVVNGGASMAVSNIVLANRFDANGTFLNPAFGDPDAIFTSTSALTDADKVRVHMTYENGSAPWYKALAAGAGPTTVRFPLHAGMHVGEVSAISDLYAASQYFETSQSWNIKMFRMRNRGGAFAAGAAAFGAIAGSNNGTFTFALTAGNPYVDVAVTVAGATAQGSTSRVYFSTSRIGTTG